MYIPKFNEEKDVSRLHSRIESNPVGAWTAIVNELTDTHESRQSSPWKVSDAPADFIDMLVGGIVGIEIEITELRGKWKLDQNRSESDNVGVIAGLKSTDDPQSHGIAEQLAQQMESNVKS